MGTKILNNLIGSSTKAKYPAVQGAELSVNCYVGPQALEMRRHPETGLWVREDGVIYRECRENRDGKRKGCLYPMKVCIDKYGYQFVQWEVGRKHYCQKVHRLVASVFIPNPNGYETVDHIDRNKANNTVKNLRWASRKMQADNTNSVEVSVSLYGVRYCEDPSAYRKAWREARKLAGKGNA